VEIGEEEGEGADGGLRLAGLRRSTWRLGLAHRRRRRGGFGGVGEMNGAARVSGVGLCRGRRRWRVAVAELRRRRSCGDGGEDEMMKMMK
jgi:hypothetical protein